MPDITRDDFVGRVNEIVAEKPTYRKGGSGTDGTCDCIGLTIGAIRRAGGAWTGTHGSNYAARYEMQALQRIALADLFIGMQVYKAYEKGQTGYDLPDTYAQHADQRDYYHAGVVMSIAPLRIMHCTSWTSAGVKYSGIKIDTALGKWLYGGPLKKVAYDGIVLPEVKEDKQVAVEFVAVVTAVGSKKPVKLRNSESIKEKLYWEVPQGALIKVLEQKAATGWRYCDYNGQKGYMQSQYLVSVEDVPDDPAVQPSDRMAAMGAEVRAVLAKYGV